MTPRDEPLLQLIRDLAGSGRARDWSARAAARRGLWTRATRDAFDWPPYLPDVPEPLYLQHPPTPGSRFAPVFAFFHALTSRWMGRWRSTPTDPLIPAKPAEHLAHTLMECHLRLARKNIAYAARWFHPLHAKLPRGLMEISDQGLIWALVVTHVRTWGERELQHVLVDVDTIKGLSSRTTLGDCVALHVLLEEWIADAAASRGISNPAGAERQAGGLRLPETLRILPELRRRDPEWSHAFHTLARRSPLTLLVYADLFDATNALPPFAPLFRMVAPGSLELWISHLARSLFAACSSPAPAEEERQRAERAYQEALAAARTRWNVVFGSAKPEENHAVDAARAALLHVANICRAQLWQRTALLAAIARSSLFFHLRFLDFLVRRSVVACDGAMKKQWSAQRDHLYDEPRDVFFFDGARHNPICRHALETLLWGRADDVPPSQLQTEVIQAWTALRPPQLGVEEIAASASVSSDAARILARRYELDPMPLSICGKWSHPPHDIWSEWSAAVSNRIRGARTGAA